MKKFFNNKKSSTPAAEANPYAAPPPPAQDDPYAMRSGPPPPPGGDASPYGSGRPRPPPPPPALSPGGGYGAGSYGASGGYGSNRYQDQSRSGSRGPGGYGGLGRADSFGTDAATLVDDESGRNELFAGANERAKQQQQPQPGNGAPPTRSYSAYPGGRDGADVGGGRDQLFGGATERYEQQQQQNNRRYDGGGGEEDDGYGGYGAGRELTEEELEEQEVQDTKAAIKQVKDESIQSLDRSIKLGEDALALARGITARLGEQGDKLHNTDKNLDRSMNYNKVAQERTAKLKTLNRSMFAVHVDNPFGANARRERMDQEILDQHRKEREQRETTRREALESSMRVERALKDMSLSGDKPQFQRNLAARAKYQFEATESDDEQEDQIEERAARLESISGGLNQASRLINRELAEQDKLIGRIRDKSDVASDGLALNLNSLSKIR